MGQEEILSFLKDNKDEWFSVKEIVKGVGCNQSSVANSLKKLRRVLFVEYRYVDALSGAHKIKMMYKYREVI